MKRLPKSTYSFVTVLIIFVILHLTPQATVAEPGPAESIEDRLSDAIVLYTESPRTFINNRLYAPIRDLAQSLNKYLFTYKGLVIISTTKNIFDVDSEKNLIEEIVNRINSDPIAIPVLMYHHFDTYISKSRTSTIVYPEEFEEHIKFLKENGYNSIFFSDLYDYATYDKPLPLNPIIITMDDGYTSNYLYAFPILKKYKTKATIFVVTDNVGKTPKDFAHFSWNEAKEMQVSGLVDIQNHTNQHDFLSKLPEKNIIDSVLTAQKLIDANVGKKRVNALAYPGGNYNDYTKNLLFKLGFTIQATGQNHLVTKDTNLTDINRINIHHGLKGKDILRLIRDLKLKL